MIGLIQISNIIGNVAVLRGAVAGPAHLGIFAQGDFQSRLGFLPQTRRAAFRPFRRAQLALAALAAVGVFSSADAATLGIDAAGTFIGVPADGVFLAGKAPVVQVVPKSVPFDPTVAIVIGVALLLFVLTREGSERAAPVDLPPVSAPPTDVPAVPLPAPFWMLAAACGALWSRGRA
jgi:hypothetical protein